MDSAIADPILHKPIEDHPKRKISKAPIVIQQPEAQEARSKISGQKEETVDLRKYDGDGDSSTTERQPSTTAEEASTSTGDVTPRGPSPLPEVPDMVPETSDLAKPRFNDQPLRRLLERASGNAVNHSPKRTTLRTETHEGEGANWAKMPSVDMSGVNPVTMPNLYKLLTQNNDQFRGVQDQPMEQLDTSSSQPALPGQQFQSESKGYFEVPPTENSLDISCAPEVLLHDIVTFAEQNHHCDGSEPRWNEKQFQNTFEVAIALAEPYVQQAINEANEKEFVPELLARLNDVIAQASPKVDDDLTQKLEMPQPEGAEQSASCLDSQKLKPWQESRDTYSKSVEICRYDGVWDGNEARRSVHCPRYFVSQKRERGQDRGMVCYTVAMGKQARGKQETRIWR